MTKPSIPKARVWTDIGDSYMCLKRVQLLYQRSYYKASTGHSLQAAILSITASRLFTQVVGIIHQGHLHAPREQHIHLGVAWALNKA